MRTTRSGAARVTSIAGKTLCASLPCASLSTGEVAVGGADGEGEGGGGGSLRLGLGLVPCGVVVDDDGGCLEEADAALDLLTGASGATVAAAMVEGLLAAARAIFAADLGGIEAKERELRVGRRRERKGASERSINGME